MIFADLIFVYSGMIVIWFINYFCQTFLNAKAIIMPLDVLQNDIQLYGYLYLHTL